MRGSPRVVALSGGVGGAKFVQGLADLLPKDRLTVIVNTGDDLRHWGLWISPDLDTVMYTLAGVFDDARGWGLVDESFKARDMMTRYGAPGWFALGDRDLATHLIRTQALAEGYTLTSVTDRLCEALGVGHRLLPMADAPHPTIIDTPEGRLPFQSWFVQRRAKPEVRGIVLEGPGQASAQVLEALGGADMILIAPSNPYVSIDPILGLDGVQAAMGGKVVVAVSPIVGGAAVKGPLGSMIPQLTGRPANAQAIARHYEGLLTGLVVQTGDGFEGGPVAIREAQTIMADRPGRRALAEVTLGFAREHLP